MIGNILFSGFQKESFLNEAIPVIFSVEDPMNFLDIGRNTAYTLGSFMIS